MVTNDPLDAFEHDHAALNEQVLRLGPLLAGLERRDDSSPAIALGEHLVALRDDLMLHFAREEEGLFPYLIDVAPDLEPQVAELVAMHDEICGAVARMAYGVGAGAPADAAADARLDVLLPLFDRFEVAYVRHSQAEHKLLEVASARLNDAQRGELAAMVAGV